MNLKIFSLLTIGLLLSLFATKPSRQDFDRELASMLREAVNSTSYDNGKDVLSNLTTIGCKFRTDDCLEILRKTYTISNKNYVFFTRHDVSGSGASISCLGLLKQFVCNASISVPTIQNALKSLW